jgi:hypothetical protein
MLALVGLGCGIVLGMAALEVTAPHYWRLLASSSLPRRRAARLWLRCQRALLARAGHHPYLVDCVGALASAADAASLADAQARLRWWARVSPGGSFRTPSQS